MEKMELMVVITNFVKLSEEERSTKMFEYMLLRDKINKDKNSIIKNPEQWTYDEVDQVVSDDYDLELEIELFTAIRKALG